MVGVAVNVTFVPEQIAPLGEAAMLTDGTKLAFTVTAVVPAVLVHPPDVTVTLYVPAIVAVALAIVGF